MNKDSNNYLRLTIVVSLYTIIIITNISIVSMTIKSGDDQLITAGCYWLTIQPLFDTSYAV
ncbi:hypothetical protein QQ39_01325 [Pragia fontium]|nr:hypothetical protein QQ39_01325 [Pragia fontium]